MSGIRLDQALARLFPEYSRSRLQQWIRDGQISVDGLAARPKTRVAGGEQLRIRARLQAPEDPPAAQAQAFRLVYQDPQLLVIDKPPGLVMHPAAGNRDQTLLNGLLHLDAGLALLPRAGIVHRLDKDTSGLLVVGRTLEACHALVAQLQARSVRREYLALVHGLAPAAGVIEAAIGRHRVERKRMAVRADGRAAITHYRVIERFADHSLLECRLETGRTHQIRVHLGHIGHPLVGDPVYAGRRGRRPARGAAAGFARQALHAWRLSLDHPASGERLSWEAPPPPDLAELLQRLRESGRGG